MIFFLYGEDDFRSRHKLLQIRDKFLTVDPTGSGLSIFDFEEGNFKIKPLDVLGMPNLLNPKRLVIIKNLISNAGELEREEILNYLKKNSEVAEDTDLVVVFFENNLPRKNNALVKFLEKNSKSQNFEKLSRIKLGQWILKRIKEIEPEAPISNSALEKLAAYSGGDTEALNSEIQKLVNFCAGKIIEDEDVEKLVSSNLNISIFETIDALGNNNKKQAAGLLHEHLKRGEDPFYLFSMFVYQFRNLLKVADLKERGMSNDYEISKNSGLHPFVVKKSLAQLSNFTLDKLRNIYQKLSELDTKIKTGKIDIQLALDKFLVEL
jgi:DNA polymerase III subunit delta